MAKIKGFDFKDGEITSVYIEDMSNIKKFNIDKKAVWNKCKEKKLFGAKYLECSNCHTRNPSQIYFNYCPNCGCKMQGENNVLY